MKHKITKRTVDGLAATGHEIVLWDTEVKGYGVRCRRSGAKHYVIKFRTGGRQRWITIGRHGSPWTPDTARAEAMRQLGLKAGGKDPASERDYQKGVITVAELGALDLGRSAAGGVARAGFDRMVAEVCLGKVSIR